MALPDQLVKPCSICMNPTMTFPPLTMPGLPNFILGTLTAQFGGISYVLGFLPPNPMNLPSPPSIDIFLKPFMASLSLPANYPAFSFGPITIPAMGTGISPFDMTGLFKLLYVCVTLPFQLILKIIEGIISLSPKLPTIDLVFKLFVDLAVSVGLSGVAVGRLGICLAKAIVGLFTALLPL